MTAPALVLARFLNWCKQHGSRLTHHVCSLPGSHIQGFSDAFLHELGSTADAKPASVAAGR